MTKTTADTIEERLLKLVAEPPPITHGAWALAQKYIRKFGEIIKNPGVEFFVFLCKDRNGTISAVYCPQQTCQEYQVEFENSVPPELLRRGLVPISLCHYHHTHGLKPSTDDVSSHLAFITAFAAQNAIIVHREEPLIEAHDEKLDDSSRWTLADRTGAKYLAATLLSDEVKAIPQLKRLLPSLKTGTPSALIEWGYSIIFATEGYDLKLKSHAQLMLRIVCNECLAPHFINTETITKLLQSHTVEEDPLNLRGTFSSRAGSFEQLVRQFAYSNTILLNGIKLNGIEGALKISDEEIEADIRKKVKNIDDLSRRRGGWF